IAEGESLKTTEGRGELILLAAGDLRLDGLEIPRLLRDLAGGHLLRAGQDEGGDERYIHGAGAAESRSRRRVAARRDRARGLDREHAQRGLQEIEPAVEHQATGVRALELLAQVFGDEPDQASAEPHRDPRRELDRAVHDDAALARRERGDVGPTAGKVETHRGGPVAFGGQVAPLHGAVRHPATVGNSPRTSIRTPLTRRFIPCTPRAW